MKANPSALSPRDSYRIEKTAREELPRVLPPQWSVLNTFTNAKHYRAGALMVIAEIEIVDGKLWIHVSASRAGCLPSWEDLRLVKDVVIGRDRKAIQILPREAEYVNIHPYVLHLYAPLEGDPLPDFRMTQNDGVVGI